MDAIIGFRQKLAAGQLCLGSAITLNDPLVSDALGDSVDFFWVDTEHGPMSAEALTGHFLAARCHNVPALVRVPTCNVAFIKPVIDAGAAGVIIPQIRTVAEVRQVIEDTRYPPLGRRGYAPRMPSNYGRDGGDEYLRRSNTNLFVSVQIETAEALDAVEEIVRVPGLDSVVIGPWDLSGSLGMLGDVFNATMVAAYDRVVACAHAAGLSVGAGMGMTPDFACFLAQHGVNWMQVGLDYGYMVKCMDDYAAQVRASVKQ
jgi:2-keto-3-deoxy-L-rhamnonate aldolase RhmA